MNNFGASSYQKEERKTVGEESAKRKVASIKEIDSKATGVALNKINPSFASLVLAVLLLAVSTLMLSGCAGQSDSSDAERAGVEEPLEVNDKGVNEEEKSEEAATEKPAGPDPDALRAELSITEDYRDSFIHGEKGAEFQKYIVLHDTEGEGSAAGVVDYWDSNGSGVAAHFIINKDGSIVQCVPLDAITHHAGFGDTGHNEKYGVEDESRDDKEGTTSIGSDFADYGMNSYSVGIEMVHVGGSGDYPEAQLEALDGLIAYIDAYYGFESTIIDHKAWRSGNSDTSAEFAEYFENYKDHRTHD
ncbi:MAG: peptidoglycan recognition family protein [Eggerthellaceae bacterium]|nr:peptidoglycan recognition family protein [Eggerthellaceae bacterium]